MTGSLLQILGTAIEKAVNHFKISRKCSEHNGVRSRTPFAVTSQNGQINGQLCSKDNSLLSNACWAILKNTALLLVELDM